MNEPAVYVITTNHPEYAAKRFPAGSVVVDPWRMVPEQPGVAVAGIGRNRPAMISLLCPTRGRPERWREMIASAYAMATWPRQVEVISYVDEDDPFLPDYTLPTRGRPTITGNRSAVMLVEGERKLLSECWNACYEFATGEILMHCGDDITFQTPGWDVMVRDEFARWPDRIVLVQGDDLSPNREALATHGFLHRRWVETVGYFVPPLFSSDWNDVWLTEVADLIGRRVRLPFITEHLHYSFGKSEHDATYREREERGRKDDAMGLFLRTDRERKNDAAKLRAAMA